MRLRARFALIVASGGLSACAALFGIDAPIVDPPDAGATPPPDGVAPEVSSPSPSPTADAADEGSACSYANVVMADSPIVYLRFEEVSGALAHDETTNHNDAQVVGSVAWGAPGAVQSAIHIGPAGGYLTLTEPLDIAANASFSIEAWVSNDEVDSVDRYVANHGSNDGFGFFVRADTGFVFEREVDGIGFDPRGTPVIGRYQHVVATYDGARVALYVDGALSSAASDSRSASFAQSAPFYLAARSATAGSLRGSLDEVAIYPRALDATTIAHHHAAGRP